MRFLIDESYNGELLRAFLRREVGVSTALLSRLKHHPRGILQNGNRVTVRALLHTGDVIDLAIEDEAKNEKILPQDLPITVLYEESGFALFDKPPFMATHPSSGHYTDTLANALVFRYGEQFCARFINRLDRNTSGVVLVAKEALSAAALSRSMARGEMQKTYLALVAGQVSGDGRIETDIRRVPQSIMLRETCPRGEGDHALTEYELLAGDSDYSLLRLHPHTGRTHQLRVHLASIGHPILGDELYGSASPLIGRQALHAAALQFTAPSSRVLRVAAPIPPDIRALISQKGWEVPPLEA